jgi:hypothetical protein
MRAGIRPERQPSRVAARRRPAAFGVAHGQPSEPAGAPLRRRNLYPKKLFYTLCELPHIRKADLLLTWVCARLHTILAQASTLPHPCWLGRIPALGIRFHTHQFLSTGCGNFWLCFGGAFFFVGHIRIPAVSHFTCARRYSRLGETRSSVCAPSEGGLRFDGKRRRTYPRRERLTRYSPRSFTDFEASDSLQGELETRRLPRPARLPLIPALTYINSPATVPNAIAFEPDGGYLLHCCTGQALHSRGGGNC